MPGENHRHERCPGVAEILEDLFEDDLLELQHGERLWKLYCFRASGHATNLRHRIYTKVKTNGRLALLTFAVHNPQPEIDDRGAGAEVSRKTRSALARVPDLSVADLDQLIAAMRAQIASDVCEELDLSPFVGLDEQVAWLRNYES